MNWQSMAAPDHNERPCDSDDYGIEHGICTACDLPVTYNEACDDIACIRTKPYCTNRMDHVDWRERTKEALISLDAVMRTLDRTAASPEDQKTYDRARALLAEHGCGGVPEEMRKAHEEWETVRFEQGKAE